MPPNAKMYLRDIAVCCEAIADYLRGKTVEDYQNTRLLRAAVERELITIGEAVNQALRLEPNLTNVLSNARRIINFRNLAVHAYAKLQADRVWDIATNHVPELCEEVKKELERS